MPILVSCPGCKSRFTVSDKFAGKKGPCPKCKATITIPVPQPEEQVKIHEPQQYATGPKSTTGRESTRPIARRETRLKPVPTAAVVAAMLVTLAVAWLAGGEDGPLEQLWWLRGGALWLVSPPIVLGGYSFLRDDELEPYRGRWLWIRAGICAVIYLGLWGAYSMLPADATQNTWNWLFIAPPFFLLGSGAALATLDLDFGSGFFHYSFYVLMTLLLGAVAGLDMPWTGVTG